MKSLSLISVQKTAAKGEGAEAIKKLATLLEGSLFLPLYLFHQTAATSWERIEKVFPFSCLEQWPLGLPAKQLGWIFGVCCGLECSLSSHDFLITERTQANHPVCQAAFLGSVF